MLITEKGNHLSLLQRAIEATDDMAGQRQQYKNEKAQLPTNDGVNKERCCVLKQANNNYVQPKSIITSNDSRIIEGRQRKSDINLIRDVSIKNDNGDADYKIVRNKDKRTGQLDIEEISSVTSDDPKLKCNSNQDHLETDDVILSGADLSKKVEIIVKDHVWCQYKLPDKVDYEYNSPFCNTILGKLNINVKNMNKKGQDMWSKVMPMVKSEYQIIRSSVTQAMKKNFSKEKNIINLSAIEMGRQNTCVYKTFCEKYIPCVIGKIKFKNHCYSRKLSEYCSVSDEAMAILIYSNNFDLWTHNMGKLNKDKGYKTIREDDDIKKSKAPLQKYFVSKNGRGHTYSQDGFKYFNEMCSKIMADRQNLGNRFDENFILHMNETIHNVKNPKKGKRKRIIEQQAVVRCFVDGEIGRENITFASRLENCNYPKTIA